VFESQTTEDRRQIAEDGKQKTEDDLKMQTEVKRVVEVVTKHLEDFNFHLALEEIYGSFWHQFCDWYIEAVKPRLRGGDEASKAAAQQVLRESLLTYLKLLHPIMPFITERLWRLFDEEPKVLMLAGWPAK